MTTKTTSTRIFEPTETIARGAQDDGYRFEIQRGTLTLRDGRTTPAARVAYYDTTTNRYLRSSPTVSEADIRRLAFALGLVPRSRSSID